jgi:ubiquinone/menaquinone biosynthesis C-methylase UbiE
VACVYGNFTERLIERHGAGASLDVADVLPIQLENLRAKLGPDRPLSLLLRNASDLQQPDAWYDQVVVFFLLHEIPLEIRKRTIREVLRVLKPGGRAVFVDYHRPSAFNPLRLMMRPLLKVLEPFALDLWRHQITDWFPSDAPAHSVAKTIYFGGLYQRVVIQRD